MKKFLYLILVVCMFSFSNVYAEEVKDELKEETKEEVKDELGIIVTLEDCVDGDTAKFKMNDGAIIKARFLAVDTPETVHPTKGVEPFGKEASNFTCTSLKEAKEIKIEYDENSDKEDNYGRKLVWVFVDGVLLQNSLVSKGYAEVTYLYGNYKYTPLLQDSQVIAKLEGVGIWSDKETKEEVVQNNNSSKEKDDNKGFIDKLIDDIVASIINMINDLLENILNLIEDVL